jgi:hypothetical protein
MTKLPQQPMGLKAWPWRLRGGAWLLASGLAHVLVLLAIVLLGSPRLLATVAPDPIVVDIVRPEEIAKGKEEADAKQSEPQPQKQEQPHEIAQKQAEPQKQPVQSQQQAQKQAEPQKQPVQPQPQPMPVSAAPAGPLYQSLYPWPVARPGSDVQLGDYRTFESTGKLDHNELAQFKARLKECWRPPAAGGNRKLTAALRVALRTDGSLAGPPDLVEVSASPDAVALVASAKKALAACGPYGFLPAESYDVWKALSLTFSPDDIAVAAVTQ